MAKNITRHVSHIKSSGGTAPNASDLLYGEIAVGYKKGTETLYIKNNNDEVIPFVNAASALAEAELYTDSHVISNAVGDSEITVVINEVNTTGRTLTLNHAVCLYRADLRNL